jgi:probable HAF family extracellular repeat protein
MNFTIFKTQWFRIARLGLALAVSVAPVCAQQAQHFTITDLGTLGGSFSLAYAVNNKGQVDGFSTLPGDAVFHSFVYENGRMIDLGTLGGPNSQSFSTLNDSTQVGGTAETSASDPNGEDFCGFGTHLSCVGFVWHNGVMKRLSTLGGNNSQVAGVNDLGQVVGYAEKSAIDPGCPVPQALQFVPVVWNKGEIQALPLYPGDMDGFAVWINNVGDAVGASGICAAFDPRYAAPIQPQHALLWRNGKAIDLGNLGGEMNNGAFSINDRGQVVGASDLPGDTFQHAFIWQDGKMTDLGTLPGDVVSAAVAINNRGQVTGVSTDALGDIRGFLWQNGVMTDLNSLIPADSPWFVLHGFGINSVGQISGFAFNTETGEVHGIVLNPNTGLAQAGAAPGLQAATADERAAASAKARKLLQQRVRFGPFGVHLLGHR